MSFKRWPVNKHGSRTRLSSLERFATVDPLVNQDCIMLDGICTCKSLDECKYLTKVAGGEDEAK